MIVLSRKVDAHAIAVQKNAAKLKIIQTVSIETGFTYYKIRLKKINFFLYIIFISLKLGSSNWDNLNKK